MEVTVTEIVRDEGIVILFRGVTADGVNLTFAVDRRPAEDIVNALIEADGDDVTAVIEGWQIVGSYA